MDAQEPSRHPGPGEVLAYDRATVERYLDDAEAARRRLEAEIADAHERRRAAERAQRGDGSVELVQLELRDLTARLDLERQETWAEVRLVLAQAEAEAQAILAAAHLEADAVRAGRAALTPAFEGLQPSPAGLLVG